MSDSTRRGNLVRVRRPHEHVRVTNIELFFDLVFVFAVTQLSHSLLKHPTVSGAVETALLFLAVWWVWIFTSWVTNWLDPERTPVRVVLLVMMLAGLALSTSIPEAFGAKGMVFAAAFVFMQVGRSLFTLWALGDGNRVNTRNFQRITAWLSLSGVAWLAGGAMADEARLSLWATAIAIEYAAPWCGFWVPGLGRSTTHDWKVEGAHFAERCSLFIIIALGESLLVTGATAAELNWDGVTILAAFASFLGCAAMWWIYFDTGAERGAAKIAGSTDPGRVARLVYTYVHLLIVAGIIVCAVADALVLEHPMAPTDFAVMATVIGGPALYLIGNLLFKWTLGAHVPHAHIGGLAMLAGLLPVAAHLTPVVLSVATALVLVVVGLWETVTVRRRVAPSTHR